MDDDKEKSVFDKFADTIKDTFSAAADAAKSTVTPSENPPEQAVSMPVEPDAVAARPTPNLSGRIAPSYDDPASAPEVPLVAMAPVVTPKKKRKKVSKKTLSKTGKKAAKKCNKSGFRARTGFCHCTLLNSFGGGSCAAAALTSQHPADAANSSAS